MGESFDLYADFDFAPPCLESARPSVTSVAGQRAAGETCSSGLGGAASAPKVKTIASVAAPLDFDLYGDLEPEAPPAASSLPASASRSSTARAGAPDGDDGEAAVSALLDFLSTTEAGVGIDGADFDGLDGEGVAAPVSGSDTEPEDGVLSVDADSAAPAAKRPRTSAPGAAAISGPGRPAAGAAPVGDGPEAGGEEDAFDFEADLQSAASRREVAAVGSSHAGAAVQGSSSAAPSSSSTSRPKGGRDQSYWYNPATKRWEQGSGTGAGLGGAGLGGGAGLQGSRPQARRARTPAAPVRLKASMCRIVSSGGKCKWGSECYFAHSQAELRQPSGVVGNEHLKRKFIMQCSSEAKADADGGVCDYVQALAVRLALRFEACPEELLSAMVQAGLPTGADQRTTVKALLRLCHPDKCKHPDAKKAVQILSPLLTKTNQ